MAGANEFNITVTVPLDHPTPWRDLIEQVKATGMTVRQAAPAVNSLMGLATQDVVNRLQAIPGVTVSREHYMGLA